MTTAVYEAIVEQWTRHYNIRIRWLPNATGACACWVTNTIHIPRPRSAEDLAVVAHEVGHIVAGTCPGTAPHQRHQLPMSVGCLACETNATRAAETLVVGAGLEWSRPMHDRLSRGLKSYGRLAAPMGERQAARQLTSDTRFAARAQERTQRALKIADIKAIAAASAPYITVELRDRQRRLEQHREISRIAAACRTGASPS